MKIKKEKGQALLIGILIIFTASVTLAVASGVIASNQVAISQNQKLSSEATGLANACLDDTLMRFSRNDFSVPPQLNTNGGTCTIKIEQSSDLNGNPVYLVTSTAEYGLVMFNKKVTKKIQASVTTADGLIRVTSLKEI